MNNSVGLMARATEIERMTKKYATLDQYVYANRMALGITHEEMAKETGVVRQTISSLESGNTAPRWENILVIVKFLVERGAKPLNFDQLSLP